MSKWSGRGRIVPKDYGNSLKKSLETSQGSRKLDNTYVLLMGSSFDTQAVLSYEMSF